MSHPYNNPPEKFTFKAMAYFTVTLGLVLYYGPRMYGEHRCEKLTARKVSPELLGSLVQELTDNVACVRSNAAFQLQKLGPKAEEALPNLIRLVADEDASVRWRSAAAIGHIGKRTPKTDKALKVFLTDANPAVRYNAVFAARETRAHELLPDLITLLNDPDLKVQRQLLNSLKHFKNAGAYIAEISPLAEHEDDFVRHEAASLLTALGSKDALDPLLEALVSNDARSLKRAKSGLITAFQELARRNQKIKTEKILSISDKLLKIPDLALKFEISDAFALAARTNPPFIEKLVSLLDGGREERLFAARMLWRSGEYSNPAFRKLIKLFNERDPSLKKLAAKALSFSAKSEQQKAEALNLFLNYLKTEKNGLLIRYGVWEAVGTLAGRMPGERSKKLLPLIIDLDIDPDVKAYVIGQIRESHPEALEILKLYENAPNPSLRYESARALKRLAAKKIEITEPSVTARCGGPLALRQQFSKIMREIRSAVTNNNLERLKDNLSRRRFAEFSDEVYGDSYGLSANRFWNYGYRDDFSGPTAYCDSNCRAVFIAPEPEVNSPGVFYESPSFYAARFYSFVYSGGAWRFDQFGGLGGVTERGDFDFELLKNLEYKSIQANLCKLGPDAGAPIQAGRIKAWIEVKKLPPRSKISINGIPQSDELSILQLASGRIEESEVILARTTMIKGGLIRGSNRILIEIPLEKGSSFQESEVRLIDDYGPNESKVYFRRLMLPGEKREFTFSVR